MVFLFGYIWCFRLGMVFSFGYIWCFRSLGMVFSFGYYVFIGYGAYLPTIPGFPGLYRDLYLSPGIPGIYFFIPGSLLAAGVVFCISVALK